MSRILEGISRATSQLPRISNKPRLPKDENRIPKSAVGMRFELFTTITEIEKLEASIREVEITIPVRPEQPNNPVHAIHLNRAHITKLNELLASAENGSSEAL